MGELHDLYMETDVLLADIFENFTDFCLKNHGLDPAHFTTAPGLSWTAALKYTEIKEPKIHIFFEKGLTGRICMVAIPFSKPNNPEKG